MKERGRTKRIVGLQTSVGVGYRGGEHLLGGSLRLVAKRVIRLRHGSRLIGWDWECYLALLQYKSMFVARAQE